MSYDVEDEVTIAAPPEVVWRWTVENVDLERSWRNLDGRGVQTLERLDDGPLGVGSRFRGTVKVGPGSPEAYTNAVTALDEHRRIAWETEDADGPLLGRGEYVLATDGPGTRFTIRLAYPPRTWVGRLQRPIVKLLAGRVFVPRMLARLKHLIEAERATEAPR